MVLSPYLLRTWPWHESGSGSTPTGKWRTHPVIQSGNGDVVWFKLPVFRYQTLDMGRIMRKPWSMPVKGQDGGLFLGWVLGGVGIDSHQKTAVIDYTLYRSPAYVLKIYRHHQTTQFHLMWSSQQHLRDCWKKTIYTYVVLMIIYVSTVVHTYYPNQIH